MTESFQIVSYNILANSYINPQWYSGTAPEILDWQNRKHALCQKIAVLDVDIICLQEVEIDAYNLLAEELKQQAYQGIYAQKGNDKPDGCATFFKPAKLKFNSSKAIYYHDRAKGALNSGHLALILSFDCEIGIISIANTHLRWDKKTSAKEQHIGYKQIKELLDYIKRDNSSNAWVICGDFNTQPDQPIVEELLNNDFHDAYQHKEQYTCNPNKRAKRLDYIFHTANLTAKPKKLLRIFNLTPLPSIDEPSDHLPIMATLTFTR